LRTFIGAVGRLKHGPAQSLCADYLKRVELQGRALGLRATTVHEIPESQKSTAAARCAEEAERMLSAVPAGAFVCALDERGTLLTSRDFAARISRLLDEGTGDLVLLIGGPDGHGPEVLARADLVLSFGPMTWPHMLARAMLAEQLYRAVTILANHPYHRE
jgi:23S rRNA (pseudouridine1915-N3)-methyltransferase